MLRLTKPFGGVSFVDEFHEKKRFCGAGISSPVTFHGEGGNGFMG
jgi:hypothetical protein